MFLQFAIISLFSLNSMALTVADKSLHQSQIACNNSVDEEIENAIAGGQCKTNLGRRCDSELYDLERLHKLGYNTYMDIYNDIHVSWCADKNPQSIPNKDYCPLPEKGKKPKCPGDKK